MATEYTSFLLLLLTVFGLGIRHGLDWDHLATIDAISRSMDSTNPLAKRVGLFFSLGHGLVVIALTLVLSSGWIRKDIPLWLDSLGTGISILFLLSFGILVLIKSLFPQHQHNLPVGYKSYLYRGLTKKPINPWSIMFIGALFAVSFDTFSQVALFSLSMSYWSGGLLSLLLAVLFMLGMMTSDSINGYLIAYVIRGSQSYSSLLFRALGISIALFSIGLAVLSLLRM